MECIHALHEYVMYVFIENTYIHLSFVHRAVLCLMVFENRFYQEFTLVPILLRFIYKE